MILASMLGILLPCWAMAQLLSRYVGRQHTILRYSLALGLSLGVSSCGYVAWLAAFGNAGHGYMAIEATIWLLLGTWASSPRRPAIYLPTPPLLHSPTPLLDKLNWLPIVSSAVLLVTTVGIIAGYLEEPLGYGDSWAIWNHRARVLYRAPADWPSLLNGEIEHADYPLLVPGCSARLWTFAGGEVPYVPLLVQSLFLASLAGTMFGAVSVVASPAAGHLALWALLANLRITQWCVAQYAETTLTFYFAAAVVVFALVERSIVESRAGMFLVGLASALAAWTKNEGLLFAGVMVCAIFLFNKELRTKNVVRCLIGAAPILALVAAFKLSIQADNDLLAGQSITATLARLLDLFRWGVVLAGWGSAAIQSLKAAVVIVPVAALLLGISKNRATRPSPRSALLVLLAMAAGYTLVLVTTPNDLAWHVRTAVDRLFSQLYPITIWALFTVLATPEEVLQRAAGFIPADQTAGIKPAARSIALKDAA